MNTRKMMEVVLNLEERKYCFNVMINNEALFLTEIDNPRLRDNFYKVQELIKSKYGTYNFRDFKVDLMDSLAREYIKESISYV